MIAFQKLHNIFLRILTFQNIQAFFSFLNELGVDTGNVGLLVFGKLRKIKQYWTNGEVDRHIQYWGLIAVRWSSWRTICMIQLRSTSYLPFYKSNIDFFDNHFILSCLELWTLGLYPYLAIYMIISRQRFLSTFKFSSLFYGEYFCLNKMQCFIQ